MNKGWTIELQRKRFAWYWRIVAVNGRVLAHSETYVRRSSALKTAQRLAKALKVEVAL
jgi:uncharacterized protein YegP (UPF0339 family)